MSMLLYLTAVSDTNIDRILADPPLVFKVISPDDDTSYNEARKEKSLLGRLFGSKKEAPPLQFIEGELAGADLEKAWHGVHYALTGTAWEGEPPLNFLLLGGRSVGDIDMGYGPARVFRSAEVREIDRAFSQVSDGELKSRLNWEKMKEAEIYPSIWDRDPDKEQLEEFILDGVSEIRNFLEMAVSNGLGAVIYLG